MTIADVWIYVRLIPLIGNLLLAMFCLYSSFTDKPLPASFVWFLLSVALLT